MHAQDLHALLGGHDSDGERAGHAVGCDRRAGQVADETLARRAEQNWTAEPVKERHSLQQAEVVVARLAEADAGIDGDAPARDA